jgi:hypothetical protein
MQMPPFRAAVLLHCDRRDVPGTALDPIESGAAFESQARHVAGNDTMSRAEMGQIRIRKLRNIASGRVVRNKCVFEVTGVPAEARSRQF